MDSMAGGLPDSLFEGDLAETGVELTTNAVVAMNPA